MVRMTRRAVLAGIATGVAARRAVAQTTTLNFVGTEAPQTFQPVIAVFQAKNPQIAVRYQQIPFASFNAQIEARLGSRDNLIDVYQADTPRVPALAARGFLVELAAYRQRIVELASPTEVTAVSYQDRIFAFPFWTGTQLLFFNRTMFTAAGLPHPSDRPEARLTWEATLDLARRSKAAGAQFGFTFAQVDRYFQLQPLFESIGAGSGLTGADLMTPNLTNDGWVRVGEWYRDLFESGLSPRGVIPEQTPEMFIGGQVPMIYGGLPQLGRFKSAPNLDFGVAPVPYFAGGRPVTSTGSWAIGVSPFAANADAARRFAAFMTLDVEGANAAMQATSAVPVNREAYPAYLARLAALSAGHGDAGAILTHEIRDTAVPRPRSRGYVVFEEIVNRAFRDIRNGADVRRTLASTEQQLVSALSRLR